MTPAAITEAHAALDDAAARAILPVTVEAPEPDDCPHEGPRDCNCYDHNPSRDDIERAVMDREAGY